MKSSWETPPKPSSASGRSRSSPGAPKPSSGSPSWRASRSWSSRRAPSVRARPPSLKITTRNIETLHFTAYKLNAESYFRKKSGLEKVESLDIGLVAPDAAWTAPVPGYARYKPSEADFELKKLALPGVYVVKVTDEKTLQATTLVLGSDLDAIVKTSRDQLLVFAQDMKTGKGRAGVRVLVSEGGQIVLDAATGADGVLLRDWNPPRAGNGRLTYLLMDGPHVAGSGLGVPDRVAQGLTARAYIYTDRPAYRPGHKVSIRGVVREVAGGQYAHVPKAVYRFEVADSRGRLIAAHPVTLSDFGTFHETLSLDSAAPVGTYRVRVFQPGKSDFAGSFEVHSYQLEPISLSFDLKKTVFYRGETIQATLVAKYQYGCAGGGAPDRGAASRRPDPARHDRRGRPVPGRVSHRGICRRAVAHAGRPASRKTTWPRPRA